MHDLLEETEQTPTRVPSNAPPLTDQPLATGIDPVSFYGPPKGSNLTKRNTGSSHTTYRPPSPPPSSDAWREPQLVSDEDNQTSSRINETSTSTNVWDNAEFTQPDWGIGSGWSGDYSKSYSDLRIIQDTFTGSSMPPIDGRSEEEELNWWDPESTGVSQRPGYGMLPPLMSDELHNPEHSLYTVSVTPPDTKPATAGGSPSTQATSTSAAAPSVTVPSSSTQSYAFVPPSTQEVLEAVPHPHAYYCRKHNGWVLLLWRTSGVLPPPSDYFVREKTGEGHPRLPSQDRRKRTTSCLDDSHPFGRPNKTHHFHLYENYADATKINPAFVRKVWQREDLAKRTRRKIAVGVADLDPTTVQSAVEGDSSSQSEMQMLTDAKEADDTVDLLDLYVCCSCSFYVLVSGVIPGVVPVKFVDEFSSEKEQNPPPGKTGQQYAFTGWETILTIIENKMWKANNKALPVNGKTFTYKVGWNLTVRKIFESLGFNIDLTSNDAKIAPPNTEVSSEIGMQNRERLLRAWIEISAYISDYRIRHSNALKDYEPHKLYVKAESARETYQRAIGAHADQLPRGGLPVALIGAHNLDGKWKKLGMTAPSYERELLQFAYLAQCRCDPANTCEYFEVLTDLLSGFRTVAADDSQELDLWLTQEGSRGRFTTQDVQKALELLGFGQYNDLQVDYDEDVDDDFVAKAWRSMVRNSWTDPNGAEKRKSLNDAFKIVAEFRHSRALRKMYDEEVTNGMTPEKAYDTLEVPQHVDEDMLITVYNMRIEEKPSQLEKMRDALKCIAEFTRSERLQKFLDSGLDPGVVIAQTRPDWPRGLNQLGNTCYLNSLLQYFYTIKDLRDAIAPLGLSSEKLVEDSPLKDDDLKNHRVGGRIVSRHEVLRSRKFVGELANLFWHMEYSENPAVTPTLDLAKLALVTSKDEEEDGEREEGGGTDTSHSTDATLVDETVPPSLRDSHSVPPPSPSGSPPPLLLPDSNSTSSPVVSSPTSILGKRPRGIRRRTSSSHSEGEEKGTEKEGYIIVSKPSSPLNATAGSDTQMTIDDDGDVQMREAGSSKAADVTAMQQKAPPLPPRPKTPKTQGTSSDMMFGKQHDVAECMDNCMFQIETALLKFGEFAGSDDSKCSIVKRLFYGKLRQRLINPDAAVRLSAKASMHEREDYFSHLPVNVSEESFDLYDGLSGYFDDTVEFEGKKTQMKVSLVELPPILQIQLQRVQFNRDTLQPYKSHAYVKFGETIAMDRFLDDAPTEKKESAAKIQRELSSCRDRIYELTQSKNGPFAENLDNCWSFLSRQADVELPGVDEGFLDRIKDEKSKIQDEISKARERASELKALLEDVWKDEKRAEYDLTAVFIHRGSSPSFGHYFIYQRWLPDHPDQWFKYNDSDVSVVAKEEVLADTTGSTANPYLLVFTRKESQVIRTVQRSDIPTEDDTAMSLL